jgi:hypothetical protein
MELAQRRGGKGGALAAELAIFWEGRMAFVTDAQENRTCDPERELELVFESSAADGWDSFAITSPSWSYKFETRRELEDDPQADPPAVNTRRLVRHVYWRNPLPGYDARETCAIIADALQAYGLLHGKPAGLNVRVEFRPPPGEPQGEGTAAPAV